MLDKKNYSPDGARLPLVIPSHIQRDSLKTLHDDPMAGDLGFYKTYERIRRQYFWPKLYHARIDDALDSLRSDRYCSLLDLSSGYWQIPMADDDKEKTAFVTPDGLYEFNVMPFGLSNVSATFYRMMDSVLWGLRWHMCLCYLDDVAVYSASFSDHMCRLRVVVSCFQKSCLQMNCKKCHFA